MSEHPETIKVVSENPEHVNGYIIKNLADVTDDDVRFEKSPVKSPEQGSADQFEAMSVEDMKAYLIDREVDFHQLTGEKKLRELCRKAAQDLA